MASLTLLCISLMLYVSLNDALMCPLNYVTGPANLCFRFAEDTKNADQAETQCRIEGGHLAKVDTNEIYNFIKQKIESNHKKATIVWDHPLFFPKTINKLFTQWGHGWLIGGRRVGKSKQFQWRNSKTLQGHWMQGQPDNGDLGWFGSVQQEDCILAMESTHGWNDESCTKARRYICQHEAINPCAESPCGNGACIANGKDYSCHCNAGWSGNHCQTKINPCAGVSCGNGNCRANGRTYTCRCHQGFHGAHCESRIDPCAGVSCGNGNCRANGLTYTCSCHQGFQGAHCGSRTNPCALGPCKNGGACVSQGNTYTCTCHGMFSGPTCGLRCKHVVTKAGLPMKLDAMFVLDSSSSVDEEEYKKALEFIGKVVDKMEISADKARVAFFQYAHKVTESSEIQFDKSVQLGKAALELRIANVEKSKGGTRTGTALEFGLKRFRSDARKDSSVAKYMFVLTDGESVADDQEKITSVPKMLQSDGVTTFAIGIGDKVNQDELTRIVNGDASRKFTAANFDELNESILTKVLEKQCN